MLLDYKKKLMIKITNKRQLEQHVLKLEADQNLNFETVAELNKNLIKDNYDYIIYYTEHPFPNCSYYFEIRNIADSGVVNVNSKSNKIRQFGKKDRLVMYERDQPFTVQDLEKMGKNFIDIY